MAGAGPETQPDLQRLARRGRDNILRLRHGKSERKRCAEIDRHSGDRSGGTNCAIAADGRLRCRSPPALNRDVLAEMKLLGNLLPEVKKRDARCLPGRSRVLTWPEGK